MKYVDLVNKIIDENKNVILDTLDYIWNNPETGYKEVKTSAYLEKAFEDLGYTLTKAGDVPGFYTVVDTGRPGPQILVLGELDALICPDHKTADKETGAAHVCGHAAQGAGLLGVAIGLKQKAILDELCGKIMLCAVPAEELLELEFRSELREKGIIKFFGGKAEFLRRGYFDDCDMAFMIHTTASPNCNVNVGNVGCIVKTITYKGKAAHAGGSPHLGINALYAATQGLNAINALRETFKDEDILRVHPIISNGGNAVNAIPDKVTIETYIRGKSFEAIMEANKKVNQALCGAALSLGANVDINDIPGYAPFINEPKLIDVASEALSAISPNEKLVNSGQINGGCSDLGDLSMVMPVVHPYVSGGTASLHSVNFDFIDREKATATSAKWQLEMLYLLLKDNAERAKDIIANYQPKFASKQEYCDYLESVFQSGDRIKYEDGFATVKI